MVRATKREAVIDEIYAIASGPKSFPATPDSDNNGTKTRTIIMITAIVMTPNWQIYGV